MREILFRGKCPYTLKWILGDYILIEGEAGIKIRGEVPYFPVIPDTIGQYTGLKDKNGEMIFEGDIIRYTSHSGYLMKSFDGVIVWDNEYACFGITMPNLVFPMHLCNIDCIEDDFIKHCEVINNIQDNPELIKL